MEKEHIITVHTFGKCVYETDIPILQKALYRIKKQKTAEKKADEIWEKRRKQGFTCMEQ